MTIVSEKPPNGQVKNSLPPILQAYASERKAIAYRPEFAKMTGSVLGAILLQQILFRFDHGNCEKFYKFSQPCKHKLYKEGDSWIEELGFSRTELANALKKIGTKSKKGTNKAELMAVEKPEFDDKGYLKNSAQLVVYWTDKSRVTWYWLNTALLGNAVNMNYLDKSGKLNYLLNQDSSITYEKQETCITSIPEITKDKPESKKRNPRIAPTGKDYPVEIFKWTPAHVERFYTENKSGLDALTYANPDDIRDLLHMSKADRLDVIERFKDCLSLNLPVECFEALVKFTKNRARQEKKTWSWRSMGWYIGQYKIIPLDSKKSNDPALDTRALNAALFREGAG